MDAPLRPKKPEVQTNVQLKGGVKIDSKSQLITLNLRDSNLRQVLRMMADKAGKNIIMHDSVGMNGNKPDTITLDLINVELNKAFEYIMTIKELTYWQDGNTLIIANNENAKSLGLNMSEVRGIKIKHIDAGRVAEFLNKNVFSTNRPNTSTNAIVTTNPATNEVLIFGNAEDVKLAEEVIDYLDVKPNITNFSINYADPVSLASKICWAAFNSEGGETDVERPAEQKEGSNITLVCGSTSKQELESSAENLISLNRPSYWVLADTGLNQVTIYGGTQEQINIADGIVKSFDKKEPQIYMEISIIELNESGSNALNAAWDLFTMESEDNVSFSGGTTQLGGNVVPFLNAERSATTNYNFPVIMFGSGQKHTISGLKLGLTIQSIIEQKKGRVLANPRVISANNVKSDIKISSDNITKVTTTTDTETGLQTTDYTISDEAGIEFSILPRVSPNKYITLTIEPKFNTIKEQITDSAGDLAATLLNRREITAKNVRVKDGSTLVLAGFIQETETSTKKKFPLLSDIPLLGTLFQDQSTTKNRSELILMITPRVIIEKDEMVEAI